MVVEAGFGVVSMTIHYLKLQQDIIKTNYYLTENEKQIVACREEGIMDVSVYRVYSKTGYCAIEGLGYLNTEEADTWPNKYMAAYFGVDSIIGE